MRCSVLQRVAVCCSVLQCVAVRCSVLQCVAVRRPHLTFCTLSPKTHIQTRTARGEGVAVCGGMLLGCCNVWQCGASVWQCGASVWQCSAQQACIASLQRGAVRGGMLQCVAMWCRSARSQHLISHMGWLRLVTSLKT